MVKRGFLVTVGAAAILVAGMSGCSSEEKESPAVSAETVDANAAPSDGATKVMIDGEDQNVSGTIVCNAMAGNTNIVIGGPTSGIAAVVSSGDSPTVQSVTLGNVNGVTLGYQQGAGQGEATVEKYGGNYKISGTATGLDMANPMQAVNKAFELQVACP